MSDRKKFCDAIRMACAAARGKNAGKWQVVSPESVPASLSGIAVVAQFVTPTVAHPGIWGAWHYSTNADQTPLGVEIGGHTSHGTLSRVLWDATVRSQQQRADAQGER